MSLGPIRFVSSNSYKIAEAQSILGSKGVEVVPLEYKLEELQTQDTEKLVRDKAMKAFLYAGRPLFVEHTGLYIDQLNGFPGGLTQVFWDSLGADKFTELFGKTENTKLLAKTVIAYVDGRRIHYFLGEIGGCVSPAPKGNRDFQWDCVFIPKGYSQTFAELGAKKNEISMRRLALDSLACHLEGIGRTA